MNPHVLNRETQSGVQRTPDADAFRPDTHLCWDCPNDAVAPEAAHSLAAHPFVFGACSARRQACLAQTIEVIRTQIGGVEGAGKRSKLGNCQP